MAGVAGHVCFAIREIRIDVGGDPKHIPRHVFLRVLIAGEVARHVAEGALHPEGGAERAHHLLDIGVRGQDSKILRRTRRRAFSATSPATLSH